jgi:DNA adenine methylase
MVNTTTSTTFMARMGGKSRLAKRLIHMFPPAKTYVEVFLGAGNVLLRMKKGEYEHEVINDKDTMMYQVFHDIQLVHPDDVVSMDTRGDRARFKHIKSLGLLSDDDVGYDWVKRLEHNLYIVWCSFSSMCTTYGKCAAKRPATLARKLTRIQQRLKGCDLRNQDCYEIIKEFKDDPDAFLYLDPPYHETNNSGYTHKTINPQALHDALKDVKGKWMVSYNHHPDIINIFSEFNITEIETTYQIKRGTAMELVITNY